MTYGDYLLIQRNGSGVMNGNDADGSEGYPQAPIDTVSFMTFGHSLWTYWGGDDAVATFLTEGGNWLARLADASGTNSGGNHIFGFYSNHNALDFEAFNAFEYSENTFDPWPSGNFPDQSFTHFMLMPSNYLQSDMSGLFPYDEPVTNSVSEFNTLYDTLKSYYPNAQVTLFCHEPDAGPWPGGADMNPTQRSNYNNACSNEYLDWFIEKQDAILASGREINLAPVGPIIADMWETQAFMSTVAFNEMYGDNSPHGSENIHLLKAMIMYRIWFGQDPDVNSLDLTGATQLIPEITNNLPAIRDYISARLAYYNANGVQVYIP